MKFFHLVALLGVASAAKLHISAPHSLAHVQRPKFSKVFQRVKVRNLMKAKWEDLTEAQM